MGALSPFGFRVWQLESASIIWDVSAKSISPLHIYRQCGIESNETLLVKHCTYCNTHSNVIVNKFRPHVQMRTVHDSARGVQHAAFISSYIRVRFLKDINQSHVLRCHSATSEVQCVHVKDEASRGEVGSPPVAKAASR